MDDLIKAKYVSHFIITIITIFVLLNIWWAYYEKKLTSFYDEDKDYGVIILICALFTWSLVSVIKFFFHQEEFKEGQEFLVKFLSILNNGLFLISITYFEHGIEWLNEGLKRRKIFIIVSCLTLVVYITCCVFLIQKQTFNADIVETIYSTFTSLILMGGVFSELCHC